MAHNHEYTVSATCPHYFPRLVIQISSPDSVNICILTNPADRRCTGWHGEHSLDGPTQHRAVGQSMMTLSAHIPSSQWLGRHPPAYVLLRICETVSCLRLLVLCYYSSSAQPLLGSVHPPLPAAPNFPRHGHTSIASQGSTRPLPSASRTTTVQLVGVLKATYCCWGESLVQRPTMSRQRCTLLHLRRVEAERRMNGVTQRSCAFPPFCVFSRGLPLSREAARRVA
ncbi:hypothetical protein FKP32DRAFT_601154 [Trametes sanguinea]|nr:hypothetical protein FKP32DRAFT_601154 [Trametes sanguinea]